MELKFLVPLSISLLLKEDQMQIQPELKTVLKRLRLSGSWPLCPAAGPMLAKKNSIIRSFWNWCSRTKWSAAITKT